MNKDTLPIEQVKEPVPEPKELIEKVVDDIKANEPSSSIKESTPATVLIEDVKNDKVENKECNEEIVKPLDVEMTEVKQDKTEIKVETKPEIKPVNGDCLKVISHSLF